MGLVVVVVVVLDLSLKSNFIVTLFFCILVTLQTAIWFKNDFKTTFVLTLIGLP